MQNLLRASAVETNISASLLVLAISMLNTGQAFAQTANAANVTNSAEIVVTAQKWSKSITDLQNAVSVVSQTRLGALGFMAPRDHEGNQGKG